MKLFAFFRKFFAKKPHFPAEAFEHLSESKKTEVFKKEAREFAKKYGGVIKALANE